MQRSIARDSNRPQVGIPSSTMPSAADPHRIRRDNIETDPSLGMPTTAGSYALRQSLPNLPGLCYRQHLLSVKMSVRRDAFLVRKLREAGAISMYPPSSILHDATLIPTHITISHRKSKPLRTSLVQIPQRRRLVRRRRPNHKRLRLPRFPRLLIRWKRRLRRCWFLPSLGGNRYWYANSRQRGINRATDYYEGC